MMARMSSLDDKIMSSGTEKSDPLMEEGSFVLVDAPTSSTTTKNRHLAAKTAELEDDEYLLVTPAEEHDDKVAIPVQDIPREVSVVTVKDESMYNTLGAWWVVPLVFVLVVTLVSLLAVFVSSSKSTTSVPPLSPKTAHSVAMKDPLGAELADAYQHNRHDRPASDLIIADNQIAHVVFSGSLPSNRHQPEPKPPRYLPVPVPTITIGPVVVRPSTMLVACPALSMSSQKPKKSAATPTVRADGDDPDNETKQPKSPVGTSSVIMQPPAARVILDLVPLPVERATTITRTLTPAQNAQMEDAVQHEASPQTGHVFIRPPATLTAHLPPRPVVAVANYSPTTTTTIQKETSVANNQEQEEKTTVPNNNPVTTRSVIVRPPTFIASSQRPATKALEELFLVKNHIEDIPTSTTRNTTTSTTTFVVSDIDNDSSPNTWFTRRIQQALRGGESTKPSRFIDLSLGGDHATFVSFKDKEARCDTKHYNNNSTGLVVLHQQNNWPPSRDWKQVFFEDSHALIHVRRAWKRWCDFFLKQQQERRTQINQSDDDIDIAEKAIIDCHTVLKDFAQANQKRDDYLSTKNLNQVLPKQQELSSVPLLAVLEQLLHIKNARPVHAEDGALYTGVMDGGNKKAIGQGMPSAVAVTNV